jgi:hypothetical protein
MYWNNTTIKIRYPSNQDPIQESFHDGRHCLFYDPTFDKNKIHYKQTLKVICEWANVTIRDEGIDGFIQNKINHYDIANLVKLNMWVDDIRKQGIVKPMLLQYVGRPLFDIGNGESRLRAVECIPSITTVAGFITTSSDYADKFQHLQQIHNFEQFAEICKSNTPGIDFLFQLTDTQAPYGIWWYEYDSANTRSVTPGEEYCVSILHKYLTKHPTMKFTKEWFDTLVHWSDYNE